MASTLVGIKPAATKMARYGHMSTLAEELVEEILLRIPPDEPAHLFQATLVCKAWRRILSDHSFIRRYHRFHRTPALLGYIQNRHYDERARFIPTTSTTSPVSMAALELLDDICCSALDCRRGRVLLIHTGSNNLLEDPEPPDELIVWDPITGGQQHLSVPPYPHRWFTGSVLCATNGCDHLDCSGGPFVVVFLWTWRLGDRITMASVYSSETGAWSAPTSIDISCCIHRTHGLLIGDALYFAIGIYQQRPSILKYDLCKHMLSVIDMPRVTQTTLVLKGDDRGLQLVTLSGNCIYMWSQQDVTNENCGWAIHKVMDLPMQLLECGGSYLRKLIGFVEGTDIIFISTNAAIFTLSVKSGQVRRICGTETYMYPILPYMSFY